MQKTPSISLALLLVALAGTGCGGSDASPTKAAFIKQADAICSKSDKSKQVAMEKYLQNTGAGPGHPMSLVQQEKLLSEIIVPHLRGEIDELSQLDLPQADEAQVKALMNEYEGVVEKAEGNPTLVVQHPDPFTAVAAKARKYGFKVCILYD